MLDFILYLYWLMEKDSRKEKSIECGLARGGRSSLISFPSLLSSFRERSCASSRAVAECVQKRAISMMVSKPVKARPASSYSARIIASPMISAMPGTRRSKSDCLSLPYANRMAAYCTVIPSLLNGLFG